LPDFYWYNIPKRGKIYQKTEKLKTFIKYVYQMAVKYSKWPLNKPTFSIPRAYQKVYKYK
jgi:hypothetical protein